MEVTRREKRQRLTQNVILGSDAFPGNGEEDMRGKSLSSSLNSQGAFLALSSDWFSARADDLR